MHRRPADKDDRPYTEYRSKLTECLIDLNGKFARGHQDKTASFLLSKVLDNGTLQAPEVKVGDKVLYGKYTGNEITTKEGEELLIMREEDILAIIK